MPIIKQYNLKRLELQHLRIPNNYQILSIYMDGEQLIAEILLHNPENPIVEAYIMMFYTGKNMQIHDGEIRFINSIHCYIDWINKNIYLHAFEYQPTVSTRKEIREDIPIGLLTMDEFIELKKMRYASN